MTGGGGRGENSKLRDLLHDLKSKSKLWAAQCRMAAEAEIKILLTKVDAAFNQIAQLDRGLADAHKQIRGLHAAKRDLHAQLGLMVHASELHAARTETSKVREAHEELGQQLRSTQGEVEKLSSALQVSGRAGGRAGARGTARE